MVSHVHSNDRAPAGAPGTDEAEVAAVLATVPEFWARYLELVDGCDGDPGAAVVFGELAELVTELARGPEELRPVLARCLVAVESVAQWSDDADELVAWSFLEGVAPDALPVVAPWLGSRTRALLEQLDGA
jgi:hypothetical protein